MDGKAEDDEAESWMIFLSTLVSLYTQILCLYFLTVLLYVLWLCPVHRALYKLATSTRCTLAPSQKNIRYTCRQLKYSLFKYSPFKYSPFEYSPFKYSPFKYSSFKYRSFESRSFEYSPFKYSPFEYSPFKYSPFEYSPFEYSPLKYNPLKYNPLKYNLYEKKILTLIFKLTWSGWESQANWAGPL
jgi:hypothetical protein